jgi:hypothetical protein
MEQALYITRVQQLEYMREGFARIYFGAEFCERLIPSGDDVRRIAEFVQTRAFALTLMTPYVTDSGLDRLVTLFDSVRETGLPVEAVFNDWGVLDLLIKEYPEFVPVMGRLLNKTKRGPRIINILDKLPGTCRNYYESCVLSVGAACDFLKKHSVYRVECDNQLQGLRLDTTDPEIMKSLYIPYVFVSTTRFCLTAGCDDPKRTDFVGVDTCACQCRDYMFQLDNQVMRVPLLRKGNAMFYVNETIPQTLVDGQFDRIVVQPEIPV